MSNKYHAFAEELKNIFESIYVVETKLGLVVEVYNQKGKNLNDAFKEIEIKNKDIIKMAILDFLISLAFCLGGIFYIWHTSKALRTGVFIGWLNGTYEKYYVYCSKHPWKFYFNLLTMASGGSLLLAVGIISLDQKNFIFKTLSSLFQ